MLLSMYQKFMKKNRLFSYGLPFVVLLVGGSFGLKQFASLRYQYRKVEKLDLSEYEKQGIGVNKGPKDIEAAYERLKETDIDNWENIRGPRPWEDSKTIQEAQRT